MARRGRPKSEPDPPQGPEVFDPAPPTVESNAVWDCVEADATTLVPEVVADLKIQECRWVDGDLAGRRFTGLRVRDAHFVRCDLSGAVLDGALLERVAFTDCRLTGAVLSGTRLSDVRLTGCQAELLNLRMAEAMNLLAEDTVLRGADLYQLTATGCALLRCDLAGLNAHDARLAGTRLHGSDLQDIQDAMSLRGTEIGPEQQITLGAQLLGALEIRVTDG